MSHLINASRTRQRGMGLVELMVGMTVGLVLILAIGYTFLVARQTNRTLDDVSRMQESARHALDILGFAIRQAGYRSDVGVPFVGTALSAIDGPSGAPDTIRVQFEAQPGGEENCAGVAIAERALVTYELSVNAEERQLICNPQPDVNPPLVVVIADHIENMQIEYGIYRDANATNGEIDDYVTAQHVPEFDDVAAVRVTLAVRGPTPNAATGGDGFLRQTYTTTYTVRNLVRNQAR